MSASFPSLSDRVLSVSHYLGLGPLTGIVRSPSSNAFLGHHKGQALAALFVLLLFFLTACLFDTAETILFVGFPDIANDLAAHYGRVAIFIDSLRLGVVLTVGVFWIGLLALAFRGSNWKVPVLKRLAERKWILRISSVINFLVLGAIPVVAIFAARGTSLTRPSGDRGAVYFLYDEGVGVPRWAFALGLYRVSLQARRNWGSQSTILDFLNKRTLRTALANAKVLILATHGADGFATTWYAPEVLRIEPPEPGARDENQSPRFLRVRVLRRDGKWSAPETMPVNRNLKLAYVFACDGGTKAAQWQEHLAPAQVITYNRVSTVWDHAVWFAFTGPKRLSKLR